MYTHTTKRSDQRCYQATWWPTTESSAGTREKAYPLMMFESGQVSRVNINNLEPITHGAKL